MPAPHVGQLARQELHETVDAVEGHQPCGGVIQPETLTEVRDESLQLPQDQAVHGVGLGPEKLEHAGRGQGGVTGLIQQRHRVLKCGNILVSEADLVGLDIGEAHGAPELLRHLHAGSSSLSQLGQGQAGGRPQQQALVSRQGGSLRGVHLSSGLTLDTMRALVSLLLGDAPTGVRCEPLARLAV